MAISAHIKWRYSSLATISRTGAERLAGKFGWQALEQLLDHISGWYNTQSPAHPLTTYVTVTAKQLIDPEFLNRLLDMLTRRKLSPGHIGLCVPLTLISNSELIASHLFESLADNGIALAIDETGSGHFSLPELIRSRARFMHLDHKQLKADQASTLTGTITAIANRLNIPVVAPDHKQLRTLHQQGCRHWNGQRLSLSAAAIAIPTLLPPLNAASIPDDNDASGT